MLRRSVSQLSVLLALSGCGGREAAGPVVTVTFWHAMGGEAQKTLKGMVEEFEGSHPDIRIDLVGMGSYDALSQKLMGAVAARNPPVIAQMYESWTTQLHSSGQLEYLDGFVRGPRGLSEDDIADIYPALLENNSWDGRLLTLPFNKSVPVYYYNVELVRSAGYDSFPRAWEEFREMCRRLTVRGRSGQTERWGTALGTDIWTFGSTLHQAGGRYLEREDGAPEFNGPAGRRALGFQVALILDDRTASPQNDPEVMNEFLTGRFATLTLSSARRATITESTAFTVGMAPIPTSGRPAAIIYGTNVGMFRQASPAQKAAAWQFIRWFTAPAQQVEWSLGTWYVPIHRRCLDDPRLARRLAGTPGLRLAYAQMDCAVFEPRGLKWLAGRKALVEELEAATLGAKTPGQALDDAAARYSAALGAAQ